jgi:hypothetical protein
MFLFVENKNAAAQNTEILVRCFVFDQGAHAPFDYEGRKARPHRGLGGMWELFTRWAIK